MLLDIYNDNMENKDIGELLKKSLNNPITFGNLFLIDPRSQESFHANYPQKFIMQSKKKITWIAAHRRSGKGLRLDSTVFTPTGTKQVGDLAVGDTILAWDGSPTKITKLHYLGEQWIYRVTFGDGRYLDTTKDHLWTVFDENGQKSLVSTEEMLNNPSYKFFVPSNGVCQFAAQPVFGAYEFGRTIAYTLGQITDEYKFNSVEVRLAVLKGLCASQKLDIKYGKFIDLSEKLAKDICWLIRSLGFCAKLVNSNEVNYNTASKRLDYYDIVVSVKKLSEIAEAQCITIDHPSHLFLADDFIVNHNCVAGETLVVDPNTLRPTPIAELAKIKDNWVFDFGKNELLPSRCSWQYSGKKKCLRVILGCGTELIVTENHKVFDSKRGWIDAGLLKPGDRLLTPTRINIFGSLEITESDSIAYVNQTILGSNIPDPVFQLTENSLKLYIKNLFANVGRFVKDQYSSFMLNQRRIALDLKHLLLRLSIQSSIDEHGNLFIWDPLDCIYFLNAIGVNVPLLEVKSPRSWEIVIDIRKSYERDVYDLGIEHADHNFLANDLVIHNSYSLTVLALWYACVKQNLKIIVFAPSQKQIDEFFDIIDQWLLNSPAIKMLQDKGPGSVNRKDPQRRTFITGSTISGFVTAANAAETLRGLTPDVIFVDEAQGVSDEAWRALMPFINGNKYMQPKSYVTGTITDPVGRFYEKIFKGSNNKLESIIRIPITENLDYSPEEIEDLRLTTTASEWLSEYLLEVGGKDSAVFNKEFIDKAFRGEFDYDNVVESRSAARIIGVDWDKYQAGTSIVLTEYNPDSKELRTIYREEVPKSQFTFINASERVIDLFIKYNPELIVIDQGYGETQWEYIVLNAKKRGLALADRILKVALNENVTVENIVSGEKEKIKIKPFLVNQLDQKFQEGKIVLSKYDEELKNQLLTFAVEGITEKTIKFSGKNEHFVDCHLFVMYGIWYLFENIFEENIRDKNRINFLDKDHVFYDKENSIQDLFKQIESERSPIDSYGLFRSDFNFREDPFRDNW